MVNRNNLRLTCSDDAARFRHQPLALSMSTSPATDRWPDNDYRQSIIFAMDSELLEVMDMSAVR
jgi:hypothetical protein